MLFAHLVPLGLALAFSTVPILAAVVIVLSPSRSRSAIPYLIGFVCGIFALGGLAALTAQYLPKSSHQQHGNETIGVVEIVVGALLVAGGAWSLLRGRRRAGTAGRTQVEAAEDAADPDAADPEPAGPRWLSSVEKLGPRSSFGVALLLNIRPKALLLAIAVGLTLNADAGSPADAVLALLLYAVLGASTVAVPIIAAVAAPHRAEHPLTTARGWLVTHGNLVTSAMLVLVGVIVVVLGIGRL